MTARTTKGERTRARIVEAAIRQFGDNGYRTTTVASVAREAEVTPATVHPYFATKHDLFLGAADESINRWLEHADAAAAASTTPWLSRLLDLIESVPEQRFIMRVLSEESPELVAECLARPAVDGIVTRLAEDIETAAALGLVNPRMAPPALAKGFETLFLGLLLLRVRAGLTNFDTRLASLGELLVHSNLFGMAPLETTRGAPQR